jgi:reactive intermediate/imine deaminase
MKQIIRTDKAPKPVGAYSQAVKAGSTVYFSGQIPLVAATEEMVTGGIEAQIRQVFTNIQTVAEAAGGKLSDIVKLNIYLTDLSHFPLINTAMAELFKEPYPARATVQVSALPKNAEVEIEAIMVLGD